ncbi:MAG: ribosome recycling factor [Kiritimatiellaeota bacterium]|nr:ribosome recycling factor [Kiritimatiellota bacterium]
MESLDDVLLEADDKMAKSLDVLKQGFAGLRTGKASPSLVENITVEYYGTPTRLRQIAGIATPEPRLIIINAYDPTALPAIEKAILAANVGITPINDGRMASKEHPEVKKSGREPLSPAKRKRLEKVFDVAVKKVAVAATSHDFDYLTDLLTQCVIGEPGNINYVRAYVENLQKKYTDDFIRKVDELLTAKEKDVLAV